MNRMFSLTAVVIIALILVSDLGLLLKYLTKPDAYALLENVSFAHAFLLHSNGVAFAMIKVLLSALLLALWTWKLIRPSRAELLAQITFMYSLFWVLIGTLVLTGVNGVLQYVAGMPMNPFDFPILVANISVAALALLLLAILGMPLALMLIPRLHNKGFAPRAT